MQKNNSLQATPNRSIVNNFNESNKLLQDIEYSIITYEEALKIINNIRSNITKLLIRKVLTQTRLKW